MADLSPPELSRRESVRLALSGLLALHGYQVADTPLLEETELFLRKSGGELAARMYSFTDPGGNRVSLRPEFTASVLRAYLEDDAPPPLPYRVQYCGPVFRDGGLDDRPAYRQFTQLGAELLGPTPPLADVEVVSLACGGLAAAGVRGAKLTLGHVGAVADLLAGFRLSERARLFLLSSVATLRSGGPEATERVRAQATELGLLDTSAANSSGIPADLTPQQAEAIVRSLIRDPAAAPLGSRTEEEILGRFMSKLRGADDPAQVERALQFTSRLVTANGAPSDALQQATELAREYKLATKALEPCRAIVGLLKSADLAGTSYTLDFGLARDIAYYTGVVFELRHPAVSGEPALCGGGRYDGLTRALGASWEIPALGFAWSLEGILETLGNKAGGEASAKGALVTPKTAAAFNAASAVAGRLRAQGIVAEMDVSGRPLNENLAYARSRGLDSVIEVDERGDEERHPVQSSGAQRRRAPARRS